MFYTEYVYIAKVITHEVGNKVAATGCSMSDVLTRTGELQ